MKWVSKKIGSNSFSHYFAMPPKHVTKDFMRNSHLSMNYKITLKFELNSFPETNIRLAIVNRREIVRKLYKSLLTYLIIRNF